MARVMNVSLAITIGTLIIVGLVSVGYIDETCLESDERPKSEVFTCLIS